jgi:hypothetical protein
MFGDRHVHDPSTVVREDHEYEEQPEGDRRHDEEVGGHDQARVIRRKMRQVCDGGRGCRRVYLVTGD